MDKYIYFRTLYRRNNSSCPHGTLVYDYADSVGGKRLLPLSVSIPQAELCLGQSWPPACCSTASTSTPLLHPSVAQGASFIIQSGFHSYHIVLCCKYVLCMQARMKNMTFHFIKDCMGCQQSPTVTIQFIYLCISLFFQQVADWALGTLSMKFTNSSINSLRKITAKHLSISHISEINIFRFKIQHQLWFIVLRWHIIIQTRQSKVVFLPLFLLM